ncbi:MAG: GNAT family N-acetyltransferase [Treponema sp.]|jgi:ribosomal protein S18 acetylase RimI-like enzyme|nr:GNAT family N-acetyltransferase [Treponema sp.]
MRFELSESLKDSIGFFMEDQYGSFLVDTREGVIINMEDPEAEFGPEPEFDEMDSDGTPRYIGLPEWDSSAGYRLMDLFAGSLKNPLIQARLKEALDRGRGVFRAFKDVLTSHPEAEKLWYAFKDREMEKEILAWYNSLRESWHMERIGAEPEESEELVLEDFHFRPALEADRPEAEKLHRLCVEENAGLFGTRPFPGDFSGPCHLVAENSGGAFAAQAAASCEDGLARISLLETAPEYRGLGLGETLLSRLLADLDKQDVSGVIFELPASAENFSRVLLRSNFSPVLTTWRRDSPQGQRT